MSCADMDSRCKVTITFTNGSKHAYHEDWSRHETFMHLEDEVLDGNWMSGNYVLINLANVNTIEVAEEDE